jgi:hypothetical protein
MIAKKANRGSRPGRLMVGLAAVALLAVAVPPGAVAAVAPTSGSGAPLSASAATVITVNTVKTEGRLPAGFIGLSYPSAGLKSGRYAPLGNLPALLTNLGQSVLRFGGNSVDSPAYQGITATDLSALAQLATKTGWKVLYSVNLAYFNAANVTTDVKNVVAKLGSSLYGVACGNEPDDFAGRERPTSYTEQTYLTTDLPACYSVLRAAAPDTLFTGPNTFHTDWLLPYATAEKGVVQNLQEHFYPMTNCHSGQNSPVTLISTSTMLRETWMLRQVKAAASVAKVPFTIGETNSASCGGIVGIGNTYASALWASSWVLVGAEGGAHAMYFNGSLSSCVTYTLFCQTGSTSNVYTAQPVYYGLLFAHLMSTGWTLPVTVPAKATGLAAFAVRTSPGNVRVMVQNETAAPASVALKVPGAAGQASTYSLTAPSLTATSGVRIQGATVTAAGTFKPGAPGHVTCKAGICNLTLPAYSAIILILPKL